MFYKVPKREQKKISCNLWSEPPPRKSFENKKKNKVFRVYLCITSQLYNKTSGRITVENRDHAGKDKV